MRHFFLPILLGLLFAQTFHAQRVALQGVVVDSSGAGLAGATCALMRTRDSVLVAFATSEPGGRFALRRVAPGDYLLQVSLLDFQTAWQAVAVQAASETQELGSIRLLPGPMMLQAVDIRAERSPLAVRNDTLEYNAAAFKVNPGDPVETLLKKMPGIEVARDGTVKAHGETVKNVLVEGKEFFGKDTRIATKNLPADAVDKVQVFDKKSELAEFSGVDDGQEERSINLKLKPGKKHGYFGKGDFGAGTEGRYSGRGNINRFSPKSQFSAIGMANNVNEPGFSLQEYIDFMGGIGAFMSGNGRVEISGDEAAALTGGGSSGVQGVQDVQGGGLHWSRDFSRKTEATANYFFNRMENRLLNTARQDNFGGTGIFTTLDDEERLSRSLGHRFGMLLRHRPDSAQRMSLRLDGGFSDAFLQTRSSTRSLNSESVLQNANLRQYRLDGRAFNLRSAFSWQHRFRRSGRSLSTSANARWAERPEQGALGAENRFTVDPTLSDTVRQRQQAGETTRQYGLTVLYTEPLGRRQYLKLEAMQQWENGARRKDFFDQASGQEVYNPLLSRAFSRDFELSRAGLAYLRNRKKYTLTAALNYQQSRLHGQMEGLAPLSWQFRRWLPALFWDYEFKTAHRMEAAYTTRLREPALEELQPLPDNSDPLNVYIGNPALRPEYVHEWRANYFRYDAFSFMSLFANLTASYTQDKIAQSGSVNALLQRSTTPLNVDHEWRLRGSVQFGAPLRPLPLSTNIRLNSTLTQGPLFFNGHPNAVTRQRHGVGISLENRKKSVVDALAGLRCAFNTTHWSEDRSLDRRFTDWEYYAEVSLTPTSKWLIDTKLEYLIYSAAAFGQRRQIPLWQLGVTRYCLKGERGRIRLEAVNLLDQHLGVLRQSDFNYVRQQNTNALGRYLLLSFGYSLSGFRKDGALEIKMGG